MLYRLALFFSLLLIFSSCTKEVGIDNLPIITRDSILFIKTKENSYEALVGRELKELIHGDKYFRQTTNEASADYSVELKNANYYLFSPEEVILDLMTQLITFGLCNYDVESELMRCSIRDKNKKILYKKDFVAYEYEFEYEDDDNRNNFNKNENIRLQNQENERIARQNSISPVAGEIYKLLKEHTDIE